MTPEERDEILADCEDRVRRPGACEGSARYVPYFFDLLGTGLQSGSVPLDPDADTDADALGLMIDYFDLGPAERTLFPELDGRDRVAIYQDEQGFVREWIGRLPGENTEDDDA